MNFLGISPKPCFFCHCLTPLKNMSPAKTPLPRSRLNHSTLYGIFSFEYTIVPQNHQVPRWTNYLSQMCLLSCCLPEGVISSSCPKWSHNGLFLMSLPTFQVTKFCKFYLLNISRIPLFFMTIFTTLSKLVNFFILWRKWVGWEISIFHRCITHSL